jgi:Sulfatase
VSLVFTRAVTVRREGERLSHHRHRFGAWVSATAIAALLATALDALLLQRKYSVFTGGFLSVDHLRGPIEAAWFLAGSLAADAAIAGVAIVLALWVASRLRLGRAAALVLAVLAGFGPLAIADVASYQLFTYLGGAFDFDLMFNLVSRQPGEILAVAGGPIAKMILAAAGLCGAAAVATALVQRRFPGQGVESWRGDFTLRRSLVLCLGVFVSAAALSTAMRLNRESFDNALRRKPSARVLGGLVTLATDVDRDGFGLLSRPRDSAPFDAAVHPYALDWPGNGIDEDGVGGDLPRDVRAYEEPSGALPVWTERPDVVLILLETFRADVVGASRNGVPVTPTLDALAARGASADQAWSHNGYTVQSRFHVLSGSLANVRDGKSLVDDFKSNGYEVGYFSGQDESFGGGALPVGYERADVFYDARTGRADRYSTFTTPGSLAVPFTVLRDRVAGFLDKRDSRRPLFLYVNFHDTHFPYTHRLVEPLIAGEPLERGEISPGNHDALWRTYLNTAANVDKAIGEVLTAVRRTTGREPAVVVTADHGESLFEEGFLGHGYALNDAQTRIPLVAAGLPLRIEQPWGQVQLRDAIRSALSRSPTDGRTPTVVATARPVFQYLGGILAPAQIAFTTATGRRIYDFRSDRFQDADGSWRPPSALAGPSREAFLELVRYWETIALAANKVH